MLLIFVTQLLWAAGVLGYGACISNALRLKFSDGETLLPHALLGFAALSMIAISLNFVVPLSPAVSLTVLMVGLALLAFSRRRRAGRPPDGRRPRELLLALLLLVYVSMRTCRLTNNYDTGLYHLQTVKWATESALPLGLANLSFSFGFNSAWHPLAGLMELPWAAGQSCYITTGVLMFFFGAALVQAWGRLLLAVENATGQSQEFEHATHRWMGPERSHGIVMRLSDVFLALCALPWVRLFASGNVSSLTADVPLTVSILCVVYFILRAGEMSDADEKRSVLVHASLLSVFALTVKLAAIPLLLVPLLALLFWKAPSPAPLPRFTQFLTVALALTLLATWLARSMALSGTLLFPVIATHFPSLPWAMPLSALEGANAAVHDWARMPGGKPEELVHSWGWLGPWAERTLTAEEFFVPVLAALAGLALILWRRIARNPSPCPLPQEEGETTASSMEAPRTTAASPAIEHNRSLLLVADATRPSAGPPLWFALLLPTAGLGFWFFTAPDLRFAYGFLFAFGLGGLALGISKFHLAPSVRRSALAIFGVFILARSGLRTTLPQENYIDWPRQRTVECTPRRLENGGVVYVPVSGDQCWNAPLPCTPATLFNPQLCIVRNADGKIQMLWVKLPSQIVIPVKR